MQRREKWGTDQLETTKEWEEKRQVARVKRVGGLGDKGCQGA